MRLAGVDTTACMVETLLTLLTEAGDTIVLGLKNNPAVYDSHLALARTDAIAAAAASGPDATAATVAHLVDGNSTMATAASATGRDAPDTPEAAAAATATADATGRGATEAPEATASPQDARGPGTGGTTSTGAEGGTTGAGGTNSAGSTSGTPAATDAAATMTAVFLDAGPSGFGIQFGGADDDESRAAFGLGIYVAYASRAAQLHPNKGQFDFVWPSVRTPRGAYV